jgi:ATP-binding cassette subfamily B protein
MNYMKQQLPKQLLPFFQHFVSPYKWTIVTLFLTGLLWGIATSLSPYLLKIVIDIIATYQGDKANILDFIKLPAIGYILVWITMAFNFRITDWVMLRFFPNIRRDIINAMFAYLSRHSHSYLQNNFAGSLSNKIMDMAGSTASILNRLDQVSANIFAFLIALISMSFINHLFSLILLIWACCFIGITILFSKKTKELSHDFSESKSILSGKIVDSVTNITNIRLFARNSYENDLLSNAVADTVHKDRAVQKYILKMRIYWDITFVLLIGGMLAGLIYMYSKGKITIGDFTFIMTITLNIFMHVWNIASQFVQFAEELGKCSQALTIIHAPHEVTDIPNAKKLIVNQGNIKFNNVSFKYQHNNNLFQNQHLEIAAGTKVGLVGFSGSGKTTFVNLILRLFDVQSGSILIDEQNIAKVTQDSLHEQISIIPQDTSLFHRSLMDNIRYGRLDACDADVIEASKKAHCHEFISVLPEGYDSLVGERGIKLSGGQRQRIAIARAILKNAPLLILDEATSALDSVTEKYIQSGLEELMKNHTTIVIAHRLSTLSEMDRIIVFDKGRIIEDGTHNKLLSNKGHYARMWQMQAGGFLPEVDDE